MSIFITRLSNVMAWIMFPVLCLCIFSFLLSAVIEFSERDMNSFCDEDDNCRVITKADIRSSNYLKENYIQPGSIFNEDKEVIYRRYPKWVSMIVPYTPPPDEMGPFMIFVLITSTINYLLVGNFRLLPWRKIQ